MHRTQLRFHILAATTLLGAAACASTPKPSSAPVPAANPSVDPRNNLKAGRFDAQQYTSNMKVTASVTPPDVFNSNTNSDLAFTGNYVIQGNYNGPIVWDISNPTSPQLVVAYTCPASQNDVSVYKNLMFISAEAQNGRVDCKPGGAPGAVNKERMRGVRVFDITNIREPKLVANVQTCRGSHTHTVLEDPKDKENVYIYVSGSAGIRSADELAGCAGDVGANESNSSRLRIEIIKVPLANPSAAAVVNRANIFAGLRRTLSHGLSESDQEAAMASANAARARGAIMLRNPANGMEAAASPPQIAQFLDSIVKKRGGTGASAATAADTATLRTEIQGYVDRAFAAAAGTRAKNGDAISETNQCHDITVYPALGLAGGACEGHGLLLDISNPVAPFRLDAVADSNFSYWHSATFNNDGTKLLFSDEWGGGGGPKCRPGDKPEWGADAIFSIKNRKLQFEGYYKIPTYQTSNENCVAHNGSLIPIPGRDVMVQSWYQGGISVFDWTDPKNPHEIASFDRGPVDSTRMVSGGSWSVYWYNGQLISSEISRGMDVTELLPSQYITQNELDAAKTVKFSQLNAQGQPKLEWPPSWPLVKAYTDQLARKGCVAPNAINSIRTSISKAEGMSGQARNNALSALSSSLDAHKGCDSNKVDLLKKALNDLRLQVM